MGLGQYIPLDQPLIVKNSPTQKTFGAILEEYKPKLLAIYYSMHDCARCQEFTPILDELYKEVNEDEKVLEVVLFSGDKSQEEFDEYYAKMPWLALPRGNKKLMGANAKKFEVKGVPRLIMLRASDGKVLSKQCLEKVEKEGPLAIGEFLEDDS